MNYYWTECPGCGCHVAVNYTVYPEKVSGSLRRWSQDRSVNDGRLLEVPASALAADGGFAASCVCGREIAVPAATESRGLRTSG
ncbi:MAG: hypothetical protein ACRD3M_12610 [Thermoanaerobaculia bacterium]